MIPMSGLYWIRMSGRPYDATHPLTDTDVVPRPGELPPSQVVELPQVLTTGGRPRTYLLPPEAAGYPSGDRPIALSLAPGRTPPSVVGGRSQTFSPASPLDRWSQVLVDTGSLTQQEAMARIFPPGQRLCPGHHTICNFRDDSAGYMVGQALQAPASSSEEPHHTYGTPDGGHDLSALVYCEVTTPPREMYVIPAPPGEPPLALTSRPESVSRALLN